MIRSIMAVPEDTDRRKCDALLAFSSWTLRTRSACLRIFNTPLENALFDHMLPSSPLGARFSSQQPLAELIWRVAREARACLVISYQEFHFVQSTQLGLAVSKYNVFIF